MKLGDILRAQTARPIVPRPVKFSAIGENPHLAQIKAPVEAVLIAVSEHQREQLRVDVEADLQKRFADKVVPTSVQNDELLYFRLFHALRDKDADPNGYHGQLAMNVTELRAALTLPEARRLSDEYDRFMEEEFPTTISQETWAALIEDAKKNSLSDLLTKYGYESVATALSSLAGRSSR